MRCVKCNYISFDHNMICPKCNKDLKDVQMMLNLPDFQPSPPFFLGVMIGEENDSSANLEIGLSSQIDEIGREDESGIEVSDDLLAEEPIAETDERELELSFDTEEPEAIEDVTEQDVISDFSEDEIGEPDAEEMQVEPLTDEELDLEEDISSGLEDISLETGDEELLSIEEEIQEVQTAGLDLQVEKAFPDEEAPVSQPKTEDESLDLDLDNIALDLEDLSAEVDLDKQKVDQKKSEQKDTDDFLLELDELSIDELESDDQQDKQDKQDKKEQPYEESEMVTMEIDRKKFGLPDNKKKPD